MIRIYGRVLVQETNAGIADLVVAVFDLDPQTSPTSDPITLTSGPPVPAALSRATFSLLQNRLGSILTDASGNFDLPISDETASHYGKDRVPDLVVAVLAPEDSMTDGNPIPRPAEDRLLHLSRSPRANAGPVEAFVIRIRRAQLDAFGIPFPSMQGNVKDDVSRLTAALDRSSALQQELRTHLAPVVQQRVDRVVAIRAKAKAVFQDLTSTPPSARDGEFRVKDMRDAEAVAKTHLLAMQAGVARLTQYQPTVRLRIGDSDVAALGLSKDDQGNLSGQVDIAVLAERMLARSGGPDLVRVHSLGDKLKSPDDVLASYRAQRPVPQPKANGK